MLTLQGFANQKHNVIKEKRYFVESDVLCDAVAHYTQCLSDVGPKHDVHCLLQKLLSLIQTHVFSSTRKQKAFDLLTSCPDRSSNKRISLCTSVESQSFLRQSW